MALSPAESSKTFISYAREDTEFALKLATDLRKARESVWLDRTDIPVGQNWPRAVEEALDSCGQFLVILSPASVGSDNVMAELHFAIEESKTILPVLYRQCKRPFRIRAVQYADFTTDYQTGLSELVTVLRIKRAPCATPPATRTEAAAIPPRATVKPGAEPPKARAKLNAAPPETRAELDTRLPQENAWGPEENDRFKDGK